jgi:hypothetical protein
MRRLALALCLLLLVVAGGCRGATQAQVSLHTDVRGSAGRSVAVWASGGAEHAETKVPVTYVDAPWPDSGDLGSLTLVPPSVEQSRAALVTALGVGVPPEWCAAHEGDGRCIVARRTFRYEPNRGLRIPVGLYRSCLGVRCDASSTCNYQGRCVSAEIDTATCSSDIGCVLPGDPPLPPGVSQDLQVPAPGPLPPVPPPSPLAPGLSYTDQDPVRGLSMGRLQLTRSAEESRVTEYQVHWANAAGTPVQLFARLSPAQPSLSVTVLPGTVVPSGAERFVAMALGPGGTATSDSVRADNFARERPLFLETGTDYLVAPTGTFDTTGSVPMLTVVGTNVSGRPSIRRCGADGSNCSRRDLDNTGRYGGALALAVSGVYGGKLYVLDTGSNAMRLFRCDVDGSGCSVHDLGSDNFIELSPSMAVDTARNRFFALTSQTDVNFAQVRLMLRRCDANGNGCSRALVPLPGRLVGHIQVLRDSGDLLLSYLDGTKQNRTFLATCRPDGSTCETFAAGPASAGIPCAINSALSPSEDAVYISEFRGDCSAATAPSTLLNYKCTLSTKVCVERVVGGTGELSPHVLVDAPRSRVLIGYALWGSPQKVNHGLHICDLNLENCVTKSIAQTTTGVAGSGSDPFVLVDAAGNISMLTRNVQAGGSALLSRCNLTAESCVYASLTDATSKLSLAFNGNSPSVSIDDTGALIVGVEGTGTGAFITAEMHRCQQDGTCALTARLSPGRFATATAWPANRSALLVGLADPTMTLAVCPSSGDACTTQDIGLNRSGFGRASVVLPDPMGQSLDVLAYDDFINNTGRPVLTSCNAGGGNCTLRNLGAEAGLAAGTFHALHGARIGGQIWVSGVLGNAITLLRCAPGTTTTGCTAENLGTVTIPALAGARYSTSVVAGAKETSVLVGSEAGIRRFSCAAQGSCVDVGILGNSPWVGEHFWFSAARDPVSNALYIARLDGARKVLFTNTANLYLSTLQADRCDDSGCIRVAERNDIAGLQQALVGKLPDGSPYFNGRPPSVFFDTDRRRVFVASTDAANLFRPLVLEFDAF